MALVVAAVLIVRADIDLGFTALAATLLNGGFLLGVVMAQLLPRLSPPWSVEETDAGFMVRDRDGGGALARVGFDGRSEADSLLTRDEVREIAANFGKRHRPVGSRSAWIVSRSGARKAPVRRHPACYTVFSHLLPTQHSAIKQSLQDYCFRPQVDNRYLAVWVRERGAWKFVAYQPTPIINS